MALAFGFARFGATDAAMNSPYYFHREQPRSRSQEHRTMMTIKQTGIGIFDVAQS